MFATPIAIDVPFRTDQDGIIRIGNSRVTLQTIIADFQRGHTPDEIADHFPAVEQSDIYVVIAYYLRHREDIDDYIHQQNEASDRVREELDSIFPQTGFKDKLLARLREQE